MGPGLRRDDERFYLLIASATSILAQPRSVVRQWPAPIWRKCAARHGKISRSSESPRRMRGTRFDCTAFIPRWGAPALLGIFRGDSDANEVQGFSDRRRRSGGGHVERSDGPISVCAGLRLSSRRLPTGAASGVFEPGIRRGVRRGGRGCEGGCQRRSRRWVVGGALGTASGTLTGTANMLSGR